MKKIFAIFTFIFSFSLTALAQTPATTILKPTLMVRAQLERRYWKQPDLPNFWSWKPQVSFSVTGPIPDASFFTVEFTTPDGKAWFSWESRPFSVEAGQTYDVESGNLASNIDKTTTIATGTFGFKITLKNNLNGTSQEMYRGTYKVGKKFAGTTNVNFKNQYAFYVEHDWALPIGYISLNTRENPKSPRLNVGMWMRGNINSDRIGAYIFYNGKQIANTKSTDKGVANEVKPIIAEGDDSGEFRWGYWKFDFFKILGYADESSVSDVFIMKKNPGIYEIKVLLDDEIVRTASFTVGSDGKLADNEIAAKNGFSGMGTIIPVKVIPVKEPGLNLQAWKTDAFYGNPLTDFTAQ